MNNIHNSGYFTLCTLKTSQSLPLPANSSTRIFSVGPIHPSQCFCKYHLDANRRPRLYKTLNGRIIMYMTEIIINSISMLIKLLSLCIKSPSLTDMKHFPLRCTDMYDTCIFTKFIFFITRRLMFLTSTCIFSFSFFKT